MPLAVVADEAKSDSEPSRVISGSSQVEEEEDDEEAASSLERVSGEMCFKETWDMVSKDEAGEIGDNEAEESNKSLVAIVIGRGFCVLCPAKLIALDSTSVEFPMVFGS